MPVISYCNSIKVRLELNNLKYDAQAKKNFNSIKVRLELSSHLSGHKPFLFQFHKGTIRTANCHPLLMRWRYFNSIKVRLEPRYYHIEPLLIEFQFHKGTIRTEEITPRMMLGILFQFHKGTIRTCSRASTSPSSCDFNSIKVRLERSFCKVVAVARLISIP